MSRWTTNPAGTSASASSRGATFFNIACIFQNKTLSLQSETLKKENMEPKIGDKMKVSPQLTAQPDWIDGEVIDVEHNPFLGLVISIKDKLGRIFFGQSRFFIAL